MRDFTGGYARTTVHQNFLLRWVRDEASTTSGTGSASSGSATPAPTRSTTSCRCPGTDCCKLGITSSMGLNRAVQERIEAMDITDPLTRRSTSR